MTTQENYIDCSVEECTHARLASGEVVPVDSNQLYGHGEKHCTFRQLLYSRDWPRLSITPVKLAPKPEPRKWEFETRVVVKAARKFVDAPWCVPTDAKVRVTLEEIL